MLYLSTRNNSDAFTVQRVLTQNRPYDGGLFVPMRLPVFESSQICTFAGMSFGAVVAEVLNLLFNTRLNGWDIEFCTGRMPVRLQPLNHRTVVAEAWHNQQWDFSQMVKNLSAQLRQDGVREVSEWTFTGVRIAVLFGVFSQLLRSGLAGSDNKVDVSVACSDFSAPMAAWYARKMGLPIGSIVCTCNENSNVWDLFHSGFFRTDTVCAPTSTPELDVAVPLGLERLIYACGGYVETQRYVDACRKGVVYRAREHMLSRLRDGISVSVVGEERLKNSIAGLFRANSYLASPYTALAYEGLQDHRVHSGESPLGLVIADRSPACTPEPVAEALGIHVQELKMLIDQM